MTFYVVDFNCQPKDNLVQFPCLTTADLAKTLGLKGVVMVRSEELVTAYEKLEQANVRIQDLLRENESLKNQIND